jgi:hypothetical protein
MSNPLLSALTAQNKFTSPEAYDKYIANYNYLISASSYANDNKTKLSVINNKFSELVNGANVFDKYLTTDVYDNILSDINTSPHNQLLKSNIMSEIQHKKINNLKSQIALLEIDKNNNKNTDIKAVKNYNNNRILNVEKRKNYTESDSLDKFIIYANGGCVAYDPTQYTNLSPINGKKDNETYKQVSFKPCNAKDETQLFVMNHINNIDNYNKYANMSNDLSLLPLSKDTVTASSLNYYLVNPVSSPEMCLNFNDSGLSVQPCNMSLSQKYSTINHHV